MKTLIIYLFVLVVAVLPIGLSAQSTDPSTDKGAIEVSGVVKDERGEPILGATVAVEGTTNGIITDDEGKFTLKTVNPNASLNITFVGFVKQTVQIEGRNQISVVLIEDDKLLEEVVVVGYGTQKKINLTGSVATISSKEIEETHASNISNMLTGRLPGVVALSTSGIPGQGAGVSIRGASSWNNAPVLFIIDGIQVDKTAFDAINIDEIENISVLKDAAAAVYGSRAANGVILVTTKRGSEGKPKFSFSTNIGISSPTSLPKLANAHQYATLWNEAKRNMGFDPNKESDKPNFFTDEEIEKARNEGGEEWFDETFKKNSINQKYNLSVNGGSDRIRYFMSLGYLNDDGMYNNFSYKRYNLRSNVDAKITDYFSIRLDLEGAESTTDQPNIDTGTLFELVTRRSPFEKIYNEDGSYYDMGSRHPIAERDHTGYKINKRNSYRGKLGLNLKVPYVQGLEAKLLFSYVKSAGTSKSFKTPYDLYMPKNGLIEKTRTFYKTELSEEMNNGNNLTINAILNYNKKIKKHSLAALFVYEQFDANSTALGASRTNFPFTFIDQMFAGGDDAEQKNWSDPFQDGRKGYIGRLNYDYAGKYLFEFSFRYDGSLKFSPEKRWGFFPAVSAGWRMSEEAFMKDIKSIDNLKLRTSYGILGNDAVGGWQWQSNYSFGPKYIFNQEPGKSIISGGIANTELTWEKTATINVGLDASFLKGMVSTEIDVFHKKTYDILGSRNSSMPGTFGATLPAENYGEVTARGFELILRHQNKIGDFKYGVAGNMSWARNKVVTKDYAEGVEPWNNPIGKPMNYRVMFVADGIFSTDDEAAAAPRFAGTSPKAGDIRYVDLNKDGVIDNRDQKIVSPYSNTPELVFGLNLTGEWKNFDMSIFFQGAAKRNVYLGGFATRTFINGASNFPAYLYEDRWTPDNLGAKYPRAWFDEHPTNYKTSTQWLLNGDYIRLKNIEFGYTLPKSIAKKAGVEKLRAYIGGANLFSIDHLPGFDPDKTDGGPNYYPQQRVTNFGLNITF